MIEGMLGKPEGFRIIETGPRLTIEKVQHALNVLRNPGPADYVLDNFEPSPNDYRVAARLGERYIAQRYAAQAEARHRDRVQRIKPRRVHSMDEAIFRALTA